MSLPVRESYLAMWRVTLDQFGIWQCSQRWVDAHELVIDLGWLIRGPTRGCPEERHSFPKNAAAHNSLLYELVL